MKKIYCTPKIIVITSDELCTIGTVSTPAGDGGRAKQWSESDFDNENADIWSNGYLSAGGYESSIPKTQSVWGD